MSGDDCEFVVEGGVSNLKQVVPPTSAEAHNLKSVWIAPRWRISESQKDKYNGYVCMEFAGCTGHEENIVGGFVGLCGSVRLDKHSLSKTETPERFC